MALAEGLQGDVRGLAWGGAKGNERFLDQLLGFFLNLRMNLDFTKGSDSRGVDHAALAPRGIGDVHSHPTSLVLGPRAAPMNCADSISEKYLQRR